jgi:hypothetical protein
VKVKVEVEVEVEVGVEGGDKHLIRVTILLLLLHFLLHVLHERVLCIRDNHLKQSESNPNAKNLRFRSRGHAAKLRRERHVLMRGRSATAHSFRHVDGGYGGPEQNGHLPAAE